MIMMVKNVVIISFELLDTKRISCAHLLALYVFQKYLYCSLRISDA